jgi:hypothetical protein
MIFTPSSRRIVSAGIESAKLTAFVVALLIFCPTIVLAQQVIPNGTIIPVQLNTSLNSAKAKPGQKVTATVMQDVPLPDGKIPSGSKVVGHVVSAKRAANGTGGQLTLRFDSVKTSKQNIPVTTNLRAIASMMEVADAQVPASGPDRGTPPEWWTTTQVGGEVVYRGGGPVANGLQSVGVPAPNGVLARVSPVPGTKCSGEVDDDRLQALWVFSSDACGAYGYPDLDITHSGRNEPVGEIVLTSRNGNVHLQSGSGMLLR